MRQSSQATPAKPLRGLCFVWESSQRQESYLAAGIIPPHNSLEMEIYTGYHFKDERLFYRLANVTNIHGEKNNF